LKLNFKLDDNKTIKRFIFFNLWMQENFALRKFFLN